MTDRCQACGGTGRTWTYPGPGKNSRRVTCRACNGTARTFDPTAIEFWACGTSISSNVAHAYQNGRTACGSPQAPSTTMRWTSPGFIACRGCQKALAKMTPKTPPPPPQPNTRPWLP